MSQRVSLNEAERKAFTMAFQDGLLDIFLGCVVLALALVPFLGSSLGDFWSSAVFLPFLGVVWMAIWLVRKNVVTPRFGQVSFGVARKSKLKRFYQALLGINIVALGLGAFEPTSVVFAPMVLVAFCAAAYFLDLRRLYVYGLLVAFSPLVGELLTRNWNAPHDGLPITFGAAATLIIVAGLTIFVRLLRTSQTPAAVTVQEV